MFCYKNEENQNPFITQNGKISTKSSKVEEPEGLTRDPQYHVIKNQFDPILLYFPDRDVVLSCLKTFIQFCSLQCPISHYPKDIYQQIIKIGYLNLSDFEMVDLNLSALYFLSSIFKNEISNNDIFAFILKVLETFQSNFSEFTAEKYINFDSADFCNRSVFFIIDLISHLNIEQSLLHDFLFRLIEIPFLFLQSDIQGLNLSQLFKCVSMLIQSVSTFSEDDMIHINHFFLTFLDITECNLIIPEFLQAMYQTKSWHLNVFHSIENEILISFISGCFTFFKQDQSGELPIEIVNASLKIANRIPNAAFPEIYEIDLCAHSDLQLNTFWKCASKNAALTVFPDDLIEFFHFAMCCFDQAPFRVQQSTISFLFDLSKTKLNEFYLNLVNVLNVFLNFIGSGNFDTTRKILHILSILISFTQEKDVPIYGHIMDSLIKLDFINEMEISIEPFKDDKEIDDLIRGIDENIVQYQNSFNDS